jgi:hypothetical protein
VDDWLTAARDRLAKEPARTPDSLDLSQKDVDELLELARIARARERERINAPLLCYLVGLAGDGRARSSTRSSTPPSGSPPKPAWDRMLSECPSIRFGPDPATAIGPTVDEDGSVRLSLSLVVE